MSPATGIAFTLLMLALMVLRVPIAVAMMVAGALGYASLIGWWPFLSFVKTAPYHLLALESFSVIPLFLMMGFVASHVGISRALFRGTRAFIGHVKGGLSIATIAGCALFGAICGSSLATAATMTQVALPEMRRHGYAGSLATGTLAAGGTLGILIPPSIALIVYAILTEQNIVRLFVAAFVPGLLAAAGYMAAIAAHVRLFPETGPAGARANWAERGRALVDMLPVVGLFMLVLGGIYAGVFTPTEGAAVGVVATLALARTTGGLSFEGLTRSLLETASATAMIFTILIGASVFNAFMALSGLPQAIAIAIGELGVAPMTVMVLVLLVYLALGCVMDSLSMILLTVPIFFPAIMTLDFGLTPDQTAIWFGILALIVVEVGLITPPVGLNVFVINRLARDVPMLDTFKGVVPFLVSDVLRVALLLAFPALTYGLVGLTGW